MSISEDLEKLEDLELQNIRYFIYILFYTYLFILDCEESFHNLYKSLSRLTPDGINLEERERQYGTKSILPKDTTTLALTGIEPRTLRLILLKKMGECLPVSLPNVLNRIFIST